MHLTEALRRSGALGPAHVRDIVPISSLKKARSNTLRLGPNYQGLVGDAPRSVILNMGHLDSTGRSSYANRHELAFYRHVASPYRNGWCPLFRGGRGYGHPWHLLLEHLTDSHFIATKWPLPPTLEQCERILHALDDDYRLSVLWLIIRPVPQAVSDLHPRVWWNNLERMMAVDDLGCRDLLA